MWRSFNVWLLFTALLYFAGGGHRGQVEAWQALGNYHNDAHPGKCVIDEGLIISPGMKVKSPKSCSEIYCSNEKGDVVFTGCGAVAAPDGCEWGDYIDELESFPKCCARHLNCKGGLNNETKSILQEIWQTFSPDLKVSSKYGALHTKGQ